MRFAKEALLAQAAISSGDFWQLQDLWTGALSYALEVEGVWGIPDMIICKHRGLSIDSSVEQLVAIEFKLRDWKTALIQAFKYRGFCDRSYVLIDRHHVKPPLERIDLFEQYNVGLLSLSSTGQFEVHRYCSQALPFSPGLRKRAESRLTDTIAKRFAARKFATAFPNGQCLPA
jgi:hypothetical protein